MNTTSVTLLERLRQPAEEEAWARFVQLYTPLIYHWARRAGLQDPDAADLVQDVFVVLVQKMPDFEYDQHKSFRSWLRTVTLNKWRDRQRRGAAHQGSGNHVALTELPCPEPDEVFGYAEYRQRLLARALQVLQPQFQPKTWTAFWEHGMQGRPAAAVAAELGMTTGAIYAAKFRVLSHLRETLDGLLD